MKLKSITLKNYRSIDELQFDVEQLDDSTYTYGLIGVNEAGKTSILKALALKDNLGTISITAKDVNQGKKGHLIAIEYHYTLEESEIKKCIELINESVEKNVIIKDNLEELLFHVVFDSGDYSNPSNKISLFKIIDDENKPTYESILLPFINIRLHKTIFWTADPNHLITNPINLNDFSENPTQISIPLKNCFLLSGITDIKGRIDLISDSTERESLRTELGEKVTKHIKRVWPKHPIQITFDISDGFIHFHIKDDNVNSKAKTADQRSDGFRQFISFLLTISAENINGELNNTIILLDEPETHLHPKAQEDLLKELISITKNDKNNLVFFATHSNYMIDKEVLQRNYKIQKPHDKTVLSKFDKKLSSYASVNYDVFEIASTDYHNELYGKAQEISKIEGGTAFDKKIQELMPKGPIKKNYQHSNASKFDCTLSTYVRHQIHHPDNKKNPKFTQAELEESIKLLLELILKIEQEIGSSN